MNTKEIARWSLVTGGTLLVVHGIRSRSPLAILGAVVGAAVAARAIFDSHSHEDLPASASMPHQHGITIEKSITVHRPAAELYRFWRNFQNLPSIMSNLISVTPIDQTRSHWVAESFGGKTVEWDAEVIHEEENALIGWRTLEGSDVQHAGSVHFEESPNGGGTTVRVRLRYDPPSRLGALLARFSRETPENQLAEDLLRFKQTMEAGRILPVGMASIAPALR